MKKKILVLITVLIMAMTCLISCGKDPEEEPSKTETQNSEKQETTTTAKKKKIDYDLTQMSSTMVYSQVLNFVNKPDGYVGKTVKAQGYFQVFYSKQTGLYYPAVVIPDATACCSQGLEFVLKGNPSYPSGYPEEGEEIIVTGTFETYYEGSDQYCHLTNAVLG